MNGRLKKFVLLFLAALLLVGTSFLQQSLNRDRERLGLTRMEPLENAPPLLAFTTVALGGFRGLIVNGLWMRANDLQNDDKFFEAVQLSDWITKLEPHFTSVWVNQAWNMAWNISVKFSDFSDRWRWLEAAIKLLRDQGLRYNPDDVLMHFELAWIFQNKMGATTDDASMYYKEQWINDMAQVFGPGKPNPSELADPQTADARARANLLRTTYKMDPVFMKKVDDLYGPLDWRLPESSAIYWAAAGLEKVKEHPTKINPQDTIQLHRVIYQSLNLSFLRGRLISNPYDQTFAFAPNLDVIPTANAAYEQAMQDEQMQRENIRGAHRNFLRDAVYFLYGENRLADAAKWYKYMGDLYPNKTLLDSVPDSYPTNLTLAEYAVGRVQGLVSDSDPERIRGLVESLLVRAFENLVLGDDDRSAGLQNEARLIYQKFQDRLSKMPKRYDAMRLPPYNVIVMEVRDKLLDHEHGLPPEMRIVLRAKLGMAPEAAQPSASTNAPAMTLSP